MTSTEYIQITHRELPYATFDADNHLYENQDALTKFLPPEYEGVDQVRRHRRPHQARDPRQDQRLHPEPDVRQGRGARRRRLRRHEGRRRARPDAGAGFGKLVAMPSIDAFFDPEPRLELMKEMGIDRTLLWPTLASVLEERVADDPDVAVRRDPRAERVDARALDLRVLRRHLLHADHQPRRRHRPRASRSSSTSTSAAPRSS